MPETADLLVQRLRPHAKSIAGSANRQSVKYVQSTWLSWLKSANVSDTVTAEVFTTIGADTVTRPQLQAMAHKADSPDGRLALLVAVLIWGRGKSNGRMRDQIIKTLNPGGGERDRVLEETARLAQQGEAAEAYSAWTLPGLRAAFFTKWLWAASSAAPDRCCLVQDARVWASLAACEWDSRVASGRKDWPSRYAAYVRDAHRCADRLGHNVSAEDIEFTLFRINGDLSWLGDKC